VAAVAAVVGSSTTALTNTPYKDRRPWIITIS
jgi:hypothetical protein